MGIPSFAQSGLTAAIPPAGWSGLARFRTKTPNSGLDNPEKVFIVLPKNLFKLVISIGYIACSTAGKAPYKGGGTR